jgi:DNA-damage-inducible protein D
MTKEAINALFQKFEQACYIYKKIECWSARELQPLMGYKGWESFTNAINKAKKACTDVEGKVSNHFRDFSETISLPKGAVREIEDIALTRYAGYLIARHADAGKPAVVFAQTYFAVQSRKPEIIGQHLSELAKKSAGEKLSGPGKKLSGIVYERGVNEKSFAIIQSKGDAALFGGFNTKEMKRKLGVPDKRQLADFLPELTIKAKDFADELSSHNVIEKNLHGDATISKEHVDNNAAVRKVLKERGVQPEKLPAAADAKVVARALRSQRKKAGEGNKRKK